MTLLDKETSVLREETLPGGGSLSFISSAGRSCA